MKIKWTPFNVVAFAICKTCITTISFRGQKIYLLARRYPSASERLVCFSVLFLYSGFYLLPFSWSVTFSVCFVSFLTFPLFYNRILCIVYLTLFWSFISFLLNSILLSFLLSEFSFHLLFHSVLWTSISVNAICFCNMCLLQLLKTLQYHFDFETVHKSNNPQLNCNFSQLRSSLDYRVFLFKKNLS